MPYAPNTMALTNRLAQAHRFRHRGLWYRRDSHFDVDEGAGVLAQDTELAGILFPVGTHVSRDVDFGHVIVRLTQPLEIQGQGFPVGTLIHLYDANPRSLLGWLFHGVYVVPFLSIWFLAVGTVELLTGAWRPLENRHKKSDSGPGIWAIADVPRPGVSWDSFYRQVSIHRDGSVRICHQGGP
jgi:hypothetical protein